MIDKKLIINKRIIACLCAVLLAIMPLSIMLTGCGGNNKVQDTETQATTTTSKIEETEKITETADEWESATLIWAPGTLLQFELRVKPGYAYELSPQKEDHSCTFTSPDGKSIKLLVEGLNYSESFEAMINYFTHKNTEKVLVGKKTSNIITTWNSSETEAVLKLSDTECLTVLAEDTDSMKAFFSTVIIKVNDSVFTPLDESEEYEQR